MVRGVLPALRTISFRVRVLSSGWAAIPVPPLLRVAARTGRRRKQICNVVRVLVKDRPGLHQSVQTGPAGPVAVLDGPPARKTSLQVMPEADFGLAVAPAQQDLAAVAPVQEVDQPAVDVLDHAAHGLDLAQLLGQGLVQALKQR